MTNNQLRVLSIDFDFFQNVSSETVLKYYPDGVDLSTGISKIVWSSRYQKYALGYDEIKNVTINRELLDDIEYIIYNQDPETECIIRQSHVHIYDAIMQHTKPDSKITISHIDFHHDIKNKCHDVDCGNWLGFLLDNRKNCRFKWYTRKTALECYELYEVTKCAEFNLDSIINNQYDLVYLCRSDAWLPPHLDVYFDELVNVCYETFDTVSIERCVQTPRNMRDIYESASLMDLMFKANMPSIANANEGIKK